MRILALDWGEVRIGAALSDPTGKFAFPLETPISSKNSIAEIKTLINEQKVDSIILGLPKNLSGSEGRSAEKLREFADKLFSEVKIPVSLVDERFTSVAAEKVLDEQGFSQKRQRGIKDNIAAQIMLQQYLDTKQ